MKERINLWIVVILVVLLVAALAYIGIGKYSTGRAVKDNTIYQQGIQLGYQEAVLQIANSAITCQQVPLVVGNQTVNVVWVECLKNLA